MAARVAVRVAATAAAEAAVECVAVSPGGERVYAGTSGGTLLVYTPPAACDTAAAPGAAPPQLQLTARRALSRKPIEGLCLLVAARRLAVLCDGTVTLLDTATMEGAALPAARGATLIAADCRGGQRPRLAVAVKRRVLLFELPPHGGAPTLPPPRLMSEVELPGSPRALVWNWDALLAGTKRGYFALSLRSGAGPATEVCPLPGDSPAPPRLAALPASGEALLLADAVGIVVSMAGAPRGNPLAFGSPPAALAQTPPYVLALAPDRRMLEVWDRGAAARVQSLALPAAPAGAGGAGGGADAAVPPAALCDDGAGGAAALAAGRMLLLLLPTPLEEQARELLAAKHAEAALALADAVVAAAAPPGAMPPPPPPPWLDTLHAEIGFARLQACAWAEACASWRQCSVFEAAELFPLFPEQAGPFRDAAPLKKYWGLHPPTPSLEALLRSTAARTRPAPPPPEALRSSWLAAAAEAASLLSWMRASLGRVPAPQRAGADTLLLLLLAETGSAAAAEALAAEVGPSCGVGVAHAAERLAALGRHVAAAALRAAAGEACAAIDILRALAAGELAEAPAADGAVAQAAARGKPPATAAAERAAVTLARCGDATLALQALPWLLDASPAAAADVACVPHPAPPLPRDATLALLRPRGGEPLIAYLQHLVASDDAAAHMASMATSSLAQFPPSPPEAALQTELGLALFAAVAASRQAEDERSPARAALRAFLARRRCAYDAAALSSAADAADAAGDAAGLPPLLRERVLLHAAAGEHAAALALLVRRLHDMDAAESYAAQRPTPAARAAAHLALLRIYLHPTPDGAEPPAELFGRAAALLAARGDALDGPGVLAELPDDASLQRLLPLLSGLLRASAHARRSGAVAAALERRRHQVAAQELAELRQQALQLDENTACGACHARLARPGELLRPFARYPTGLLACHRCSASLAVQGPTER